MKTNGKCRICGKELFSGDLMRFAGQPRAAQDLPDREIPDEPVSFCVKECSHCGVIQLDSDPVPYFREVIRAAGISGEQKEFRKKEFTEFIRKHSLAGKKILECGCGAGEFTEIMSFCGVSACGIEYGEKNLVSCREKGLCVEKLYFETGNEVCREGPFDAFFILNYLEHIPDLPSYLAGIRRNLKEEAVGLVEVPDFGMMLQNATFAEFTTDHLYYFTEKTLRHTLESNGFEVLSRKNLYHSYILSLEVRKRRTTDLSSFETARKRLAGDFREITGKSEKYAVWGASHQAFAVLAEFLAGGECRKPVFIVDSAPFKQGHISPATHIDIVPPDRLEGAGIDTLLVIAGGYSDEVARIASRKYGDLRIWILRANGWERFR